MLTVICLILYYAMELRAAHSNIPQGDLSSGADAVLMRLLKPQLQA